MLLTACSASPGSGEGAPAGTPAPAATPAGSGSGSGSGFGSSPEPSVVAAGPQPLPASRLRARSISIPSIGVRSPLVPLGLGADGELEAPGPWDRPGWFADGTVPGETGPAVVAGHVDSPDGPAVFWRLSELGRGDVVEVERSDGRTARFVVTRNEQFEQADFPSTEVYGPTPGRELRLITCAGIYDREARRYLSNRVVFAVAEDQLGLG